MPLYLVRSLALPKSGNDQSDYEDAACVEVASRTAGFGRATGRLLSAAVADGATESSFAGLWAQLLVQSYVRVPSGRADVLRRQVARCAASWHRAVDGRPLPWYAEEKARMGAFSTLLGITVALSGRRTTRGRWQAVAVGDSCLFQVRGEELLVPFPVRRSSDFGSSPLLMSSNLPRNEGVWRAMQHARGTWRPDDDLFLATDALAAWFLEQAELGERPWNILRGFADDTDASFVEWVGQMRAERRMKNDDVTLVHIRMACDAPAARG